MNDFVEVALQDFGGVAMGGSAPLALIAGPCVIESRDHCLMIAERLQAFCDELGVALVFKASFDKANRSSHSSYRGPGLDEGLEILAAVKQQTGLPLISDVHEAKQAAPTAEVVDALQVPAFLCRQTDLIAACVQTGKPLNLKKGQFMAPQDAQHMIAKARALGGEAVSVTERGYSFGYNNLVVDMRGLSIMRAFGAPVIFDATHSVQLPGAGGASSGGERHHVPVLARAAVAAGVDALYVEVHEAPERAKSDGPNALTFEMLEALVPTLKSLDHMVTGRTRS